MDEEAWLTNRRNSGPPKLNLICFCFAGLTGLSLSLMSTLYLRTTFSASHSLNFKGQAGECCSQCDQIKSPNVYKSCPKRIQ